MKKIMGLVLAATLGGGVALGAFQLINLNTAEDEAAEVNRTFVQPVIDSGQGTFASYLPSSAGAVDFVPAASSSLNGVVHVTTAYEANYQTDPFMEFFFGEDYQRSPYQPATASGSGVIISTDGFIVTNNHVIEDADAIKVTLNDNREFDAELIGTDPSTDLALLKVQGDDLPYITYGNSDEVQVGEWVLAVGNPFNLTSTVTAGIISAKGRDINILDRRANGNFSTVESFLQTDAAVNPGNSGGALVNTKGELIGINTAIKSNTGSYTGYSFSIPVNIVRKVVDDLLEFGTVQRAYIGVSIRNLDAKLAQEKGISQIQGVYVAGTTTDGAAKEAGIETGDVITKIGNVGVNDVPELQEQISKFRPGNSITVTVVRDGEEKEFNVELRNQFGNTELVKKENSKLVRNLGAEFEPINSSDKRKLNIKSGLRITKLNGGKLRSAGIKEGFIITNVDKAEINTFEDLTKSLENQKGGVLIEGVYPNGMRYYYGVGM